MATQGVSAPRLESSLFQRSLKKIAATAPRREAGLRKSCTELLAALKAQKAKLIDPSAASCSAYFTTLFAGLASPTAKVQVLVLDITSKLLAAGFLAAADPASPERALRLMRAVCKCAVHDDAVALQALKALNTLTTCPAMPLSGDALLETLKICFRVARETRNANNRVTAKSCLQQMCLFVLQRYAQIKVAAGAVDAAISRRSLPQPPTRAAPEAAEVPAAESGAAATATARALWSEALYPAVRAAIGMDRIAGGAPTGATPTVPRRPGRPEVPAAAQASAAAAPPASGDADAPPPPPPRRSHAAPIDPALISRFCDDAATVFRWLCIMCFEGGATLAPLCIELLHAMLRSEAIDRRFVVSVAE